MKAAKLHEPDIAPSNIIFFPNAKLSHRLKPSGVRRSKEGPKAPPGRKTDPIAPSLLDELFALKRQEMPPENFLRDFVGEFGRRNYVSGRQFPSSSPSDIEPG